MSKVGLKRNWPILISASSVKPNKQTQVSCSFAVCYLKDNMLTCCSVCPPTLYVFPPLCNPSFSLVHTFSFISSSLFLTRWMWVSALCVAVTSPSAWSLQLALCHCCWTHGPMTPPLLAWRTGPWWQCTAGGSNHKASGPFRWERICAVTAAIRCAAFCGVYF